MRNFLAIKNHGRRFSLRLPQESFEAIFNLDRLFYLFGLFEIPSQNALQNNDNLGIFTVISDFEVILTSQCYLPKMTLNDS